MQVLISSDNFMDLDTAPQSRLRANETIVFASLFAAALPVDGMARPVPKTPQPGPALPAIAMNDKNTHQPPELPADALPEAGDLESVQVQGGHPTDTQQTPGTVEMPALSSETMLDDDQSATDAPGTFAPVFAAPVAIASPPFPPAQMTPDMERPGQAKAAKEMPVLVQGATDTGTPQNQNDANPATDGVTGFFVAATVGDSAGGASAGGDSAGVEHNAMLTGLAATPGASPVTANVAASPPLAMGQPGWINHLAHQIETTVTTLNLTQGMEKLTLTVTPEKLGHLQIQLEVIDGMTHVHFVTETAEAARLMTDAQPRLAELFARSGLELGSQSSSGSPESEAQQHDRSPQQPEPDQVLPDSVAMHPPANDLFPSSSLRSYVDLLA